MKFATVAIAILATSLGRAAEKGPHAFLANYCYDCHDEDTQKGEMRFDTLVLPPKDKAGVIEVQAIIDQLNLGEMPPKKAKHKPDDAERAAVIAELTQSVDDAVEALASTGAQTVLRRLNRREYLNTVSDLFALDLTAFDPTTKFPRDATLEHMDNIGHALVTSGYLLDQYLDAADQIVEKALGAVEQPAARKWQFKGNFQQGQELSYSHKRVYGFRYLCVYEVPNTTRHEGGYAAIHEFSEGVPADGFYEIDVLAHSVNRKHPYKQSIFGTDPEEPFRLGVVPGDIRVGILHHPQPIEPQLAEVTVRDGDPRWYKMRVYLHKGQTPRFIFPNGMANCRNAFSRIAREYKSHWPKSDPYKGGIVEARRIVLQHGKMPHIRIHEVGVHGPLYDQWPTAGQRMVFGEDGFGEKNTRDILQRFADCAYRRPATKKEIDRLMAVAEQRRAQGHTPRQAVTDAIKAALCSPAFLYLAEPGDGTDARELGAHDLAARLSYFLWSTAPDPELRACADRGELLEPEVLSAQFARLLADPRSDAFVTGFLDSWLNLRALGDMPPDRETFATYYSKDLQAAMKREAALFTRNLIEKDLPITHYLDSDYTFANKPLAEHYGLPVKFEPERAHEFKLVKLDDRRRGGLLGMGSVLTVTANGIETSPVNRGVWLLENILGTPPPPPPDDVPPIDPDVRGSTSVREQLTKHRESPTCYGCHQKIDPAGFALENFDPVGKWRTHYPLGRKQGPKIDPSGELASGEAFDGLVGFKALLLEREDLFARMLTERLLTYATGRRMEALDRPAINRILRDVRGDSNGLRTLMEKVVLSPLFRSR